MVELTVATVSEPIIPCFAKLAMSSALVAPVHLQAMSDIRAQCTYIGYSGRKGSSQSPELYRGADSQSSLGQV